MTELLDTIAAELPDVDRDEIASVMAEMDGGAAPKPEPARFDRHHHNGFGVSGAIELFHGLRKAGRRQEAAKIAEAVLAILTEHPDLQTHVDGQDIVLMRSYVKEGPARKKYARRRQRERMLDAIQTTAFQALLDKAAPPNCPFTLDPSTKLWHDRDGGEISPRTVARYHRLAEMHSPQAAEQIARAVDEFAPLVEQRAQERQTRQDAARAELEESRRSAERIATEARESLAETRRMASELAGTVESRDQRITQAQASAERAQEAAEKPVTREQSIKYDRRGLIESVLVTDAAGHRTRKVMERGADGRVVRVRVEEFDG